MELLDVAGCPYEDYSGQILEIRYRLTETETVWLGDYLTIELMDGSVIKKEIKIINPKYAGDFSYISQKAKAKVDAGEYGMSEKVLSIKGPGIATFVVTDVAYHDVKTDHEIAVREAMEMHRKMVCISPFKETHCGEQSIYDFVCEEYSVPNKVIAYLRTTEPYMMCPGIYNHPFKPGTNLLGPYTYTDGHYWWDRDTWKYVLKYHVALPQEFIDHVLSDAGTLYLEQFAIENKSWGKTIQSWKNSDEPGLILLPDNAGALELDEF